MKKFIVFLGVLLSLGIFSACSNDDEMGILIDEKVLDEKFALFEDSIKNVPENDYTGALYYDSHYGWCINLLGTYYDYACDYYIPVNLPDEFKANKGESLKVSFSGKVIKLSDEEIESLQLWRYDGTESIYIVYITKIRKAE